MDNLLPARRLVPGSIVEGPLQSFLAVGCIAGWPIPDKGPEVLDKLVGGREAADAQGQEDPASGVRGLGRVVGQLLADLTIDFVTELSSEDAVTYKNNR